ALNQGAPEIVAECLWFESQGVLLVSPAALPPVLVSEDADGVRVLPVKLLHAGVWQVERILLLRRVEPNAFFREGERSFHILPGEPFPYRFHLLCAAECGHGEDANNQSSHANSL